MDHLSWDFVPDEELKIEENTKAVVTAIPGREGDIVTHRKTGTGKDLLSIQFQIAEGPYRGRRASLTLWPDPNNWGFRRQVEALTDIKVSDGHRATMDDINASVENYSFEVTLGLDRNGYTVVKFIDGRVERRELEASAAPSENGGASYESSSATSSGFDDEDIPF